MVDKFIIEIAVFLFIQSYGMKILASDDHQTILSVKTSHTYSGILVQSLASQVLRMNGHVMVTDRTSPQRI